MARTLSNMLPLGTTAPDFRLLDTVSGKMLSLAELASDKGTVIMFICNHCPYVIHVQDELLRIAAEYQKKGVGFVAISANDAVKYPDDAPEKMAIKAKEKSFGFPYLYDETQEVAHAYMAACTPDFYVFDGDSKLVYRGRMDESTPGNGAPVTGKDLTNALNRLLDGGPLDGNEQFPSMGCNIKWKG